MKRFCLLGAAALVFALVGVMAAQPLHEKVTANFSYPVHVEGQVLPPGQYTIVQQNKPTGAFGLLIQGNGAEIVTDASTMDIIDKPAAPQTEVVLAKVGNDYYLDKIWIQGRTTGWQVMLPNNFNRQQSMSVELPATHKAVEQQSSTSQSGQPMQSQPQANSTGRAMSNPRSPSYAR